MREATGQAEKTAPPDERTEDEKNPEAVKRGSKGGEKGGKARKAALSPERRKQIARDAARARWDED